MMDLFGNLQQKQEQIQQELKALRIQKTDAASQVKVTVNGLREVLDIELDAQVLSDQEQLQDLLVLTLNDALAAAKLQEAEKTQSSMQEMLPPGLGNLKDMFGG